MRIHRWVYAPESRTSMIASLLGVEVERRRAERASRLMRGRVAMVMEDILGRFCMRVGRKSGRNQE